MLPHFFFFNDTATTEIYTLSLHDALPISTCHSGSSASETSGSRSQRSSRCASGRNAARPGWMSRISTAPRSEEHTSELQSRQYLVCRLLLEKKNTIYGRIPEMHDTTGRPV